MSLPSPARCTLRFYLRCGTGLLSSLGRGVLGVFLIESLAQRREHPSAFSAGLARAGGQANKRLLGRAPPMSGLAARRARAKTFSWPCTQALRWRPPALRDIVVPAVHLYEGFNDRFAYGDRDSMVLRLHELERSVPISAPSSAVPRTGLGRRPQRET